MSKTSHSAQNTYSERNYMFLALKITHVTMDTNVGEFTERSGLLSGGCIILNVWLRKKGFIPGPQQTFLPVSMDQYSHQPRTQCAWQIHSLSELLLVRLPKWRITQCNNTQTCENSMPMGETNLSPSCVAAITSAQVQGTMLPWLVGF